MKAKYLLLRSRIQKYCRICRAYQCTKFQRRYLSLAVGSDLYPTKISKIELISYGRVSFTRTDKGFLINITDQQVNKIAPIFRIKK